jgi:uncharacterized protein
MFYWIAGIALFIISAFFAMGYFGFKTAIVRPKKKKPPQSEYKKSRELIRAKNNEYLYSLAPEDVSIRSSDGLTLKGWLLPSKTENRRFVICVHGYHCNGPDEFSHMVPFYHDELDYNYLLPDDRAHGRSEGKYIGFGALDHKDILQWVDYLIVRFGKDIEIILHGISMGAATVMLANSANPPDQVKIIIEDCGFTSACEEFVNNIKYRTKLNFTPLVLLMSLICKIKAGYYFKEADCLGKLKQAKNPILFIHGGADTFVPTHMGKRLYEACPVPKDLLIVEGAVHAYSYYDAPKEYQAKVKGFIGEHMDGKA